MRTSAATTLMPGFREKLALGFDPIGVGVAGKSKPVLQSNFFETMSEATRSGKAALAELRAKQAA